MSLPANPRSDGIASSSQSSSAMIHALNQHDITGSLIKFQMKRPNFTIENVQHGGI